MGELVFSVSGTLTRREVAPGPALPVGADAFDLFVTRSVSLGLARFAAAGDVAGSSEQWSQLDVGGDWDTPGADAELLSVRVQAEDPSGWRHRLPIQSCMAVVHDVLTRAGSLRATSVYAVLPPRSGESAMTQVTAGQRWFEGAGTRVCRLTTTLCFEGPLTSQQAHSIKSTLDAFEASRVRAVQLTKVMWSTMDRLPTPLVTTDRIGHDARATLQYPGICLEWRSPDFSLAVLAWLFEHLYEVIRETIGDEALAIVAEVAPGPPSH